MAVFSGNAHPKLAHDIARYLHVPLARAQVGRFSDGEINVEILENIRGRETFIIQPTCPPASENLMELLVMVDAARRASAARITAVIPYFGFARQDRRPRSARVPITAKLVAKMIGISGVDRVLTVDLHADQIQGFSTSQSITSTHHRYCSAMSGSTNTTKWSWSRLTSVALFVPGPWQNGSTTRTLSSSTNVAIARTNLRS